MRQESLHLTAFGAVAIFIIAATYKPPIPPCRDLNLKVKLKRTDIGGSTILMASIVCLLLALQWGGIKFPWSNSKVWGCLIGFGCLLLLFVILQIHRKDK